MASQGPAFRGCGKRSSLQPVLPGALQEGSQLEGVPHVFPLGSVPGRVHALAGVRGQPAPADGLGQGLGEGPEGFERRAVLALVLAAGTEAANLVGGDFAQRECAQHEAQAAHLPVGGQRGGLPPGRFDLQPGVQQVVQRAFARVSEDAKVLGLASQPGQLPMGLLAGLALDGPADAVHLQSSLPASVLALADSTLAGASAGHDASLLVPYRCRQPMGATGDGQ